MGRVIGALFVGVDVTAEIAALQDDIGKLVIGDSGYHFVVDASKTARIAASCSCIRTTWDKWPTNASPRSGRCSMRVKAASRSTARDIAGADKRGRGEGDRNADRRIGREGLARLSHRGAGEQHDERHRRTVARVNAIVDEIGVASREQASGIEQVNSAVMLIGEAAQQNAALVGEAEHSTIELRDQAEQLARAVKHVPRVIFTLIL